MHVILDYTEMPPQSITQWKELTLNFLKPLAEFFILNIEFACT